VRAGQYLLVCAIHVRRRAGGAEAVFQQLIHCLGEPPEFAQPGAAGRLEPARRAEPDTGQRDQQPAVPVRKHVGGLGEEALHRGRVPDEFGDHRRVRTGELHRGQAGLLGGEPPVFGAGEHPAAAWGVVVQELRLTEAPAGLGEEHVPFGVADAPPGREGDLELPVARPRPNSRRSITVPRELLMTPSIGVTAHRRASSQKTRATSRNCASVTA
jgi:hypothetical protein